ncbi:transcriptional regulator, AraC family [Pseudoduganella flava]|uniref:Helix-turn-helix domain-containing protein n=1 Tax=Pseudoduganella flava TaxID=871742 RepID=A0A562PSA8_9BURK|nr:AraC family transcriptional regulator [Pseudoduganella flava]QGZ39365.1 helix-turn-helix domain-containing protein [Pseudoduganella flava]TWI47322.1 transcriptional regulator, AraC family [Pseudoduganella flava]
MTRAVRGAGFTIRAASWAGVTAVDACSDKAFPRHSHAEYGIGVILRGAQRSASARGNVDACAGDVIMVNPGEVHDGAPLGTQDRAWSMLYLPAAVIAQAVADLGGTARGELAPVVRDDRAAVLFKRLHRAALCDRTALLAWEEALLALLSQVSDGLSPAQGRVTPGVQRARQMLDDDPAGAWSLADLAAACGIDRFQLVRAFARATGLTPHAYLMQRRVDMACALLGRGMPLADAALASGFADQSHMTRVFTARYGITPGQYRQAVAGRAISFKT